MTKMFLICFRNVQNVFQKQNNLRRHRHIILFNKICAGKQSQRIRLNPICLQFLIRHALKNHRQIFRPFTQRFWQRCNRRLNFRRRHRT